MLKYKGKKKIGFEYGKYFASILISSDYYKTFDAIIPGSPSSQKGETTRI